MREPFQGGWNRCPICGKDFRVDQPGEWLYVKKKRRAKNKYTKIYLCSWKCVREAEKESEASGGKQE